MYTLPLRLPLLVKRTTSQEFGTVNSKITQMQSLGFLLGGKRYHLSVHSFVCYAPARAMLKQTKLHSGYHGCECCEQRGEHWCNNMVFPATDAVCRTDVRFDELADEQHHVG